MSEVDFPEPAIVWHSRLAHHRTGSVRRWIIRCISDHPRRNRVHNAGEYSDLVDAWFSKWFSQFIHSSKVSRSPTPSMNKGGKK